MNRKLSPEDFVPTTLEDLTQGELLLLKRISEKTKFGTEDVIGVAYDCQVVARGFGVVSVTVADKAPILPLGAVQGFIAVSFENFSMGVFYNREKNTYALTAKASNIILLGEMEFTAKAPEGTAQLNLFDQTEDEKE